MPASHSSQDVAGHTEFTQSATKPVIVRCATCQTLNRVNLARLADKPKCSRCANLLPLDRPLIATDADFETFVSGARVPVVVDFYADWCGPCKAMAPILESFAKRRAGEVLVLKVDTDANPQLSQRFRISSIPTLVVFKNGVEAQRQVGVATRDVLERMIT
ncbi:MAG: thioredoxin [Gemmatimonadaceae bacterium]